MQGESEERWRKLCEQAEVEQDSEKLIELTHEINALLDDSEQRRRAKLIKLRTKEPDGHAN